MRQELKNRLLDTGLLICILILLAFSINAYFKNEYLVELNEEKTQFIREFIEKDSLLNIEHKRVNDTLESYKEKLSWILDGEKVDPNAMVNAYTELDREKQKIELKYNLAQEYYGFDVKFYRKRENGELYNFAEIIPGTKADSAKITYRYFKDRIYFKDGAWRADVTSKKDLQKANEKIEELSGIIKGVQSYLSENKQ